MLLEKLGARRKKSHFAGPGPEPASRVSYDPRAPFLVSSVSMRSLKPRPFCFLTLLTVDLTLCGCSASIISSSYCSRRAMLSDFVKSSTRQPLQLMFERICGAALLAFLKGKACACCHCQEGPDQATHMHIDGGRGMLLWMLS